MREQYRYSTNTLSVCRSAHEVACRAPTTSFSVPPRSRPCHKALRTEEGRRSVLAHWHSCSVGCVFACSHARACALNCLELNASAPVWGRLPSAQRLHSARVGRSGSKHPLVQDFFGVSEWACTTPVVGVTAECYTRAPFGAITASVQRQCSTSASTIRFLCSTSAGPMHHFRSTGVLPV